MRARSALRMLVAVVALAVAGPWTTAKADDWPAPGDFYAGRGVILADVAFPSGGAAGFRVNLPTGGEIDAVGRLDWGTVHGDDMFAVGGYVWNVDTQREVQWFTFAHQQTGPDVYVTGSGSTVVDRHDVVSGPTFIQAGIPPTVAPGTYGVVIWAATNSASPTSRFRLHAPADATLLNETTSSSTFMRTLRQFSGTAGAAVVAPPQISAYAAVNMSTSIDVAHSLYGEFGAGPNLPRTGTTVPTASYTDSAGRHDCAGQVMFNGAAGGPYTFTLNAMADANAGPIEPFVAGADIETP